MQATDSFKMEQNIFSLTKLREKSHLNLNHKKKEIKHERSCGSGGYFNSSIRKMRARQCFTSAHRDRHTVAPSPLPWERKFLWDPQLHQHWPCRHLAFAWRGMASSSQTHRQVSHVFLQSHSFLWKGIWDTRLPGACTKSAICLFVWDKIYYSVLVKRCI